MDSIDDRVRRYAEAIQRDEREHRRFGDIIRDVMAVADAEQAELRAEVERLRQRPADSERTITDLSGDSDGEPPLSDLCPYCYEPAGSGGGGHYVEGPSCYFTCEEGRP